FFFLLSFPTLRSSHLDLFLNDIPGSVSAFPSLDLLLNYIPGRVPALSSLDLLLNYIPGSVSAFPSLDLLPHDIPGSVPAKSKNVDRKSTSELQSRFDL